jgi:hypothetical protein
VRSGCSATTPHGSHWGRCRVRTYRGARARCGLAGLVEVCNDIVLNDRRRIVELGGGISTVLLARLLAQVNGSGERRLAAVEHDARWRRRVVGQLAREAVGEHIAVGRSTRAPRTQGSLSEAWGGRGGDSAARVLP